MPTAPHHDDLGGAVDALASEGAIRRLLAAYLDAVDRGRDGARVAGFFADDVFEGVGHLLAFLGRHQGRPAIAAHFDATRQHLTFSLHLPANEAILVEGDHARGSWTYLQAAVHDGQPVWVAGRWRNRFTRVAGEWRIARITCEGVFLAPYRDGWPPSTRPPDAPGADPANVFRHTANVRPASTTEGDRCPPPR